MRAAGCYDVVRYQMAAVYNGNVTLLLPALAFGIDNRLVLSYFKSDFDQISFNLFRMNNSTIQTTNYISLRPPRHAIWISTRRYFNHNGTSAAQHF